MPKLRSNWHHTEIIKGSYHAPEASIRGGQTSGSRLEGGAEEDEQPLSSASEAQPTQRVRRAISHPEMRTGRGSPRFHSPAGYRCQAPPDTEGEGGGERDGRQRRVISQLAQGGKLGGGGRWRAHCQEISQEGRGSSGERTPQMQCGVLEVAAPPGSSLLPSKVPYPFPTTS